MYNCSGSITYREQISMTFSPGDSVGPYRIVEQLGRGGVAIVYKAYHPALDRHVAVKVLNPAFNEDPAFIEHFEREARLVARLGHPNIVPVYDFANYNGRPYLVMKYIEGETLKSRLARGAPSNAEILAVVTSMGAALSHAHRQGILHLDIKPSNVLIGADGTMYLADFGLAHIAHEAEHALPSDSVMGTPQYISPEQALGISRLDEGTDIYSFGVMLYEMVVGRVPFDSESALLVLHDHIYTPLPLPRSLNPCVTENVERVLLKALAKIRSDRYLSVDEFASAFQAVWNPVGGPSHGAAPSPTPPARDPDLGPLLPRPDTP
jgi:serine/threonine-protein kinase